MGEYEPKIEVQFPEVVPVAKSSTVKLECFALGKYVPLRILICDLFLCSHREESCNIQSFRLLKHGHVLSLVVVHKDFMFL